MLTDHERHLLTEIESQLGSTDPRLAARLTGARRDRLRFRLRAVRTPMSLGAGLTGAVVLVAFFATVPWLGVVGLVLLGVSLHANATRMARVVTRVARRLMTWLRGSGATDRSATA